MATQARPRRAHFWPEWLLSNTLFRLLCAALFVGAGFVVAQLALNGLRAAGVLAGRTQLSLAAFALFVPLTYGAYRMYLALAERRAPAELGGAGAARELGAGLAGGLALFALVIGALWLIGAYRVVGTNGWAVLVAALASASASAFVQELLFRGVLLRIASARLGAWPAIALSLLLFGAAHLAGPGASALSTAGAMAAGLLFAGAFMCTGRLWLAIGLHAAWDFANDGVFGVAVAGMSGQPIPGLLRAELRGPDLLTGGAFGVEASAVAVAVVLLAALALLAQARRVALRQDQPSGTGV